MNLPDFAAGLPKAVAIDLDGTLLDSHGEISPRTHLALELCTETGLAVIIATARPARWMPRLFTEKELAAFSFINQNGSVVRASPPFSGSHKVEIPPGVLDAALATLQTLEPDIRLTLEIEGCEFGGNVSADPDRLWARNAATPDMYLPLEAARALDPSKIAASCGGRDLSSLTEQLEVRFGDVLSIVPGDGLTFLNITMKEATKPAAIEKLVASAGWTLNDVLALGDDIPDLDMLRACGTAVAMANACHEVLAVCPYRTLSNDEGGVALVLEKLLETSAPR